jgi:threonine synthase
MPDVVVYPIGGGVALIGIWKAFNELLELGWIEGRLPRFVVTQYEGCAPLVEAFRSNRGFCEPWPEIATLPGGLRSPQPLADFIVLDILRDTAGTAIAVSSDDALAAVREIMLSDGVFICPKAGTTIVALRRLLAEGWIGSGETVAVINTATGLKSTSLFPVSANRVADAADEI